MQEEVGGIEWFEMNMLRLGVSSPHAAWPRHTIHSSPFLQRPALILGRLHQVGETDRDNGKKKLPSKEDVLTFLHRIRAAYEVDEGVRRTQVGGG